MNKLRVSIALLCCAVSVGTFGQSTTYLGVETAATHDLFTFIDEGNKLSSDLLVSGYYGITVSQSIGKSFILESGMIIKHYLEGYDYEINPQFDMIGIDKSGTSSNSFISLQVPVRIKAEFPLIHSRFSFFSSIGYLFNIRLGIEGGGSGGGSLINESFSITTSHVSRSGLAKTFSLIETGIGISYNFSNHSKLYLTASYFSGFKNIIELDVEYTISDNPTYTAQGVSTGDYWSMGIGYSYPIRRMK